MSVDYLRQSWNAETGSSEPAYVPKGLTKFILGVQSEVILQLKLTILTSEGDSQSVILTVGDIVDLKCIQTPASTPTLQHYIGRVSTISVDGNYFILDYSKEYDHNETTIYTKSIREIAIVTKEEEDDPMNDGQPIIKIPGTTIPDSQPQTKNANTKINPETVGQTTKGDPIIKSNPGQPVEQPQPSAPAKTEIKNVPMPTSNKTNGTIIDNVPVPQAEPTNTKAQPKTTIEQIPVPKDNKVDNPNKNETVIDNIPIPVDNTNNGDSNTSGTDNNTKIEQIPVPKDNTGTTKSIEQSDTPNTVIKREDAEGKTTAEPKAN